MALLAFPRFLWLPFASNHRIPPRRKRYICSFSAAIRENSSAILWFKHDLRVDDHPGLLSVSKYRALVPLYIFDHRILSRYSDEMLELVLLTLKDLRKSLKEQGSNLMIRFGKAESVLRELLREVEATAVFAEEEAEYDLRRMMDIVNAMMEIEPFSDEAPRIILWRTPFYKINVDLEDLPASYDDFKKLKLVPTAPISLPILPSAGSPLDWGPLPTFDEVKGFMNENPCKSEDSWILIKQMSAESTLQEKLSKSGERNENNKNFKYIKRKRLDNSVFVTQKGNIVGGGTNDVLNALAAYLRYLEGTARGDWQEVHERQHDAESRDGTSFVTLFGPAIRLGIISRRRVNYEAIKYEKERNAGFLSPFGFSAATVAAAADTVCSMEWYWLMALKSQIGDGGRYSIRIWRWRGHLIQYTVVGHGGPAVLLVHGFGAFLEHYRHNMYDIAKGGNSVWAVTVLGFGRSEKPNVVYTELMWAELLRDFIVEVVGEPVHLVGNSVGGYFVAIIACLWPTLARSVVLINSAGNVIPGYSSLQISQERQSSGVTWLGARLLLYYLRLNLKNILKSCYPTRTERADDWLIHEMLRASHDPGAVVVLESIFSFDLSVPLNYLLEGLKEKVLIIQGMKDPISDSKSKLAMLREHCAGLVIRELNAGHCPHDEIPEDVNSVIGEWIVTVESKLPAGSLL